MNRLERAARRSKAPVERIVPITYQGFKCRPAGRPRQRRHKWASEKHFDGAVECVRCGAMRNPAAKP